MPIIQGGLIKLEQKSIKTEFKTTKAGVVKAHFSIIGGCLYNCTAPLDRPEQRLVIEPRSAQDYI